jgi:hypothetical protein
MSCRQIEEFESQDIVDELVHNLDREHGPEIRILHYPCFVDHTIALVGDNPSIAEHITRCTQVRRYVLMIRKYIVCIVMCLCIC